MPPRKQGLSSSPSNKGRGSKSTRLAGDTFGETNTVPEDPILDQETFLAPAQSRNRGRSARKSSSPSPSKVDQSTSGSSSFSKYVPSLSPSKIRVQDAKNVLQQFPYYLVPSFITNPIPSYKTKKGNLLFLIFLIFAVTVFLGPPLTIVLLPAVQKFGGNSYGASVLGLYEKIIPYQNHLYRVKGCCYDKPKTGGFLASLLPRRHAKHANWKNSTGAPLSTTEIRDLLGYRLGGYVMDLGTVAHNNVGDKYSFIARVKQMARAMSANPAAEKKSNWYTSMAKKVSDLVKPPKAETTAKTKEMSTFQYIKDYANSVFHAILPKASIVYTALRHVPEKRPTTILEMKSAILSNNISLLTSSTMTSNRPTLFGPLAESFVESGSLRLRTLDIGNLGDLDIENQKFRLPEGEHDFIFMDFALMSITSDRHLKFVITEALRSLKPKGKLLFIEPTSSRKETSYLVRFVQSFVLQPVCFTLSLGSCSLNRDVISTLSKFAFASVNYVYVDAWESPYAFTPLVYGIATRSSSNWLFDMIFN